MIDGLKDRHRNAIIEVLASNDRVERASLFGSRAMETFTPDSDVDIALFGEGLTMTDQGRLAAALEESAIPQRVDLVLYDQIDNDALREHIRRHGIEWYRRPKNTSTARLHLRPSHRRVLEALLREHLPGVEVWAYGSRVSGKSHDGSDLALVLRGPGLKEIPSARLENFEEAVRESGIPFLVEARDWARLPERFHGEIERNHVVLVERRKLSTNNEWRETILGEVIELKRGYDLPQQKRTKGLVPIVSSSGIIDHHQHSKVSGPGVVIGRCGTLGQVYFLQGDFWPLNTALYVRDFKGNDPCFIGYFLKNFDVSSYSDKAAVPGLNRNHLHQGIVRIPSCVEEQRAIAHILGTFDDKIELNRRMNETLEAMARAIFKDWFVDFGPTRAKMEGREPYLTPELWNLFPDALDDKGKPVGWKCGTVGEYFQLTMGQSPPGSTYNDDGEGLPFFQGRTDFGFRYPQNRRSCTAPTRVAGRDDTLVSVRAPVGDINMAWEKCCAGRGIAVLRHRSGARSFTYYSAWAIQQELKQYEQTGTVFGAINKGQFEALSSLEPIPEIVELFEQFVGPLDERIRKNTSENRTLAQTRDTLLPELISGDIILRDIEQRMGAIT